MSDNNHFSHKVIIKTCGRGEELMAYLYGESGGAERLAFARHMSDCPSCREEFAAFTSLRERLAAARSEAFEAAPRIDFSPAAFASTHASRPAQGRSALAALREFFSLAPYWLQAASAAALLVFFTLSIMTIMRADVRWDNKGFSVQTGNTERVVEVAAPGSVTKEEAEALAAQRVEAALSEQEKVFKMREAELAAELKRAQESPRIVVATANDQKSTRRNTTPSKSLRGNRLNNLEKEADDEQVVSLYDLLREAN